MPSSSLFKVAYPPRRRFNIDIKVWIGTLTVLNCSSGCSSGSDHCSCVTEAPACDVKNLWGVNIGESLSDMVSFAMPYTMRLFNKTIMALEYIFPSTAEVVSKYATLLGIRNKTRLMIAMAAVQVET